MSQRPLIIVSNDDGITSHGIRNLVEVMSELGEVVVVAPDSPQSGMGHAITVGESLRLDPSDLFPGITAYQCSGTPADCIKLAKHYVLKDRMPDLVVSGVNHGSNSSVSILYSGTMSAAIEGAIEGYPAIGFSLCDYGANADFSHARPYIKEIAAQVLKTGLPKGIALNVNIPANNGTPIKGIKICRQARGRWKEDFDERHDPYNRRYFWLVGSFINMDQGDDTDVVALEAGYIAVVPSSFDLTGYQAMVQLNEEWSIL